MDLTDAVNMAMDFIDNAGYPNAKLKSIKKISNVWHIILDVGILYVEEKIIKINDEDEEIIEYSPK